MRAPVFIYSGFARVSGSIGGTRLILNVRRMALRPHSASLDPSSAMELPVVRNSEPASHFTHGPSFGNPEASALDDHMDDTVDGDIISGFNISPSDYGERPAWTKHSGVSLP